MTPETQRRKALEERAADWLAALDSGSADRDAFEAWRSTDPSHAAAFLRVAATWASLESAGQSAAGQGMPFTPEPTPVRIELDATRPTRRTLLRAAGFGGAFLLAGAGAFATRGFAQSAETQTGERRLIQLGDGSSIELNTDTQASWRIRGRRHFWLSRGEVALVVAADHGEPCLLEAGSCKAMLSAGQFNARLGNQGLHLTVVQGHALVRGGSDDTHRSLRLATAETGTFAPGGARAERLSDADISTLRAWQQGEIVLQGETLGQAVAEYNRYLPRKLVLKDPRLAGFRLGGRFLADDPTAFLAALQVDFGVKSTDNEQAIFLSL